MDTARGLLRATTVSAIATMAGREARVMSEWLAPTRATTEAAGRATSQTTPAAAIALTAFKGAHVPTECPVQILVSTAGALATSPTTRAGATATPTGVTTIATARSITRIVAANKAAPAAGIIIQPPITAAARASGAAAETESGAARAARVTKTPVAAALVPAKALLTRMRGRSILFKMTT